MGKLRFRKSLIHTRKVLPDGRMVLQLDWVWCHEIKTPNAILDATGRGCDVVFNPNRVKAMIDHVNPAKDTAFSQFKARLFASGARSIRSNSSKSGRNGVCHAVIPEKGSVRARPESWMTATSPAHTAHFGLSPRASARPNSRTVSLRVFWICPPRKSFGEFCWQVASERLLEGSHSHSDQ